MDDQQADTTEFQDNLIEDNDVLGGGDFIDDFPGLKGMFSGLWEDWDLNLHLWLFCCLVLFTLYTMHLLKAQNLKYLSFPSTTAAVTTKTE